MLQKKNQDPDMVFTGLQLYLGGSELHLQAVVLERKNSSLAAPE